MTLTAEQDAKNRADAEASKRANQTHSAITQMQPLGDAAGTGRVESIDGVNPHRGSRLPDGAGHMDVDAAPASDIEAAGAGYGRYGASGAGSDRRLVHEISDEELYYLELEAECRRERHCDLVADAAQYRRPESSSA
jgi:hypothetical protein